MPKHFFRFLAELEEQRLLDGLVHDEAPNANKPTSLEASTDFSQYTIVPQDAAPQGIFSDATEPSARPSHGLKGAEAFLASAQAFEERFPLRAAVVELRTLLRVLRDLVAAGRLDRLGTAEYTAMLAMLEEWDILCERCTDCPADLQRHERYDQ